jgi:hypothetical protein
LWKKDFYIDGVPCGLSFLRVIIRESHLDSNAATAVLRTELSQLDQYMATVGHNILAFNEKVQSNVESLGARDATTTDLLTHLFIGYKVVPDKNFRTYIDKLESEHFEGRDLSPTTLMMLTSTRYRQLLLQKRWEARSEEEEKLLAMQAKLDDLSMYGTKSKREGGEGGEQDQPTKRKAGRFGSKLDPGWLLKDTKPTPIDKVMTHKGKAWHFCCEANGGKCGGKWRVHKPSECRGTAGKKRGGHEGEKASAAPDTKRLKIMAAVEGLLADDYESDQN